MLENVTLGSDTEYFLVDKHNALVPAALIIKGSKHRPHRFGSNGYATQVDGLTAEVNIPPVTTPMAFAAALTTARRYVDAVCARYADGNPDRIVKTVPHGAVKVPGRLMNRPEVIEMGCDPSYNAWDASGKAEQIGDPMTPVRGAGLHVHIGYKDHNEETNRKLARALDLTLGTWAALDDPFNAERRKLGYGRAGSYRNQPHGVEYRALSTWSGRTSDHLIEVALRTLAAIQIVRENVEVSEQVRFAIDRGDATALRDMSRQFGMMGVK